MKQGGQGATQDTGEHYLLLKDYKLRDKFRHNAKGRDCFH